jgi:hypothetical protein
MDQSQLRCARQAEEQRDAVEHGPGTDRAEQNVLQRCLIGLPLVAEISDHDVAAQRDHFQRQEQHQHVHGGGQENHPQGHAQQQCIKLADILLGDLLGSRRRQQDKEGG